MAIYNTGTLVDGHPKGSQAINSTLSTQIIIKVNNEPVGALQRLTVNQTRPLTRIQEIGTDGVIEIVPSGATNFELTADRIVFDQLRLPEAFSRGFRFINSQRLPFDILVIDLGGIEPPGQEMSQGSAALVSEGNGHISMVYRNCWFTSYNTPYAADNYLITETATIWCETAFVSSPTQSNKTLSTLRDKMTPQIDNAGIETSVNWGGHRGAMDASGLLKSIFTQ
jgi:hypothetical protein